MFKYICPHCKNENIMQYTEEQVKNCTTDCFTCGIVVLINDDLTVVDLYANMQKDLEEVHGIKVDKSNFGYIEI